MKYDKELMSEVLDIEIYGELTLSSNYISWVKDNCEVIGNIYENPELLKEQ